MAELLKHARAVAHMSETEQIHARLWSGLKNLPHFADDIPRRPVEGNIFYLNFLHCLLVHEALLDFKHILLPHGVRRFVSYYPAARFSDENWIPPH